MRDGIFKTLSMAPSWRQFMQKCGRIADRGERTLEAAERALSRDVRAEMSTSFLSAIRTHTSSLQGQLGGLGAALPQWTEAGDCSPMEKIARSSLARHAQEGVQGRELLQATLSDTLEAWGRQRVRQVEQQISIKDRIDAGPALQEARSATSRAARLLASEVADGSFTKKRNGRRSKLDLDEDLRGSQ